jgi:hypothetical protein
LALNQNDECLHLQRSIYLHAYHFDSLHPVILVSVICPKSGKGGAGKEEASDPAGNRTAQSSV